MIILVINSGSSSIKYRLFHSSDFSTLAFGLAEKIGEETSLLSHTRVRSTSESQQKRKEGRIANHRDGLLQIVDLLLDSDCGAIQNKEEISAVGHRVVHGGESFKSPTIVDDDVIEAITENTRLAPLHNPPNLIGIEVARDIFPGAVQVAVFDTAFHQTMPEEAFLYAIPYDLYERNGIRRYGFHGTSHSYVAERAAAFMNRPLSNLNLITIHLGNGASMAAIKKGKCVDTSMGMTPLAGLVMGTRSGDLDPAIPIFLADQLGMSLNEIDDLLNKGSGLKGICETNDMRSVIENRDAGDVKAKIAFEIYVYRIRKYIGAYYAALEHVDALVFTAGIGENSPEVRALSCKGLHNLGIKIHKSKNNQKTDGVREIHTSSAKVKVLVIPTNEELKIAEETRRIVTGK